MGVLVAAWRAWDAADRSGRSRHDGCGSDRGCLACRAAVLLEAACEPVAAAAGVTVSELRHEIAARRRAGCDHREAIEVLR